METASTINEATAAIPETIEVTGGGASNFDELEAFHDADKSANKSAKPQKKEAKSKEDKEDVKSDGKEVLSKKDKEHSKEQKEIEKTIEKIKHLKVKAGEKDVELPENALIPVTVDGKVVEVPVNELLSNYSGKTVWAKKFSELDRERSSFNSQRNEINNMINSIHEQAMNGNPQGAIQTLAEAMGADPIKVWGDLYDKMAQSAEEHLSLSPEARQARKLQEENEYLKSAQARAREQSVQTKQLETLGSQIEQVMETHSIPKTEYWEAYDELKVLAGNEAHKIEPQDVAISYETGQIVKEIIPNATPEERHQAMVELFRVRRMNPEFTKEDVADVAQAAFGNGAARNLTKKVERAEPANTARPSKERKADPISWDDIDDM